MTEMLRSFNPQTQFTDLRKILRGGTLLGASSLVERLLAFGSSTLAARFGGPQTFGSYAFAMGTANSVASYVGLSVGTTSTRFVAAQNSDQIAVAGTVKNLLFFTAAAALLGFVTLNSLAGPIAHLMTGSSAKAPLVHLSAMVIGAILIFECCKGIFVGAQRYIPLLASIAVSGSVLILGLPNAARQGPSAMVTVQLIAVSAGAAVALCLIYLGLRPSLPALTGASHSGSSVKQIMAYGTVQWSAFLGMNIVGWTTTGLLARHDRSMQQLAFYAIASQFRAATSMLPTIFSQVSFPLLAGRAMSSTSGTGSVLQTTTVLNSIILTLTAFGATSITPTLLSAMYGETYASAIPIVRLGILTAALHLCASPLALRLNIISLKATASINGLWAGLSILGMIILVPSLGAAGAMLSALIAHLVSLALVSLVLNSREPLGSTIIRVLFTVCFSVWLILLINSLSNAPLRLAFFVYTCVVTFLLASFVFFKNSKRLLWIQSFTY